MARQTGGRERSRRNRRDDARPDSQAADRRRPPMPTSSTWRPCSAAWSGSAGWSRTFAPTASCSMTARRPAGSSSEATRSISCRCSSRTTPSTRRGGSRAWTTARPWSSTILPGSARPATRRQGRPSPPVRRRPGSRGIAEAKRAYATGPSFGAGAVGLVDARPPVGGVPRRHALAGGGICGGGSPRGSRRAWPGWRRRPDRSAAPRSAERGGSTIHSA